MAVVSVPNTFSPNTTISSSQVNSNFSTIYNEFNGSISAANLATDAVTTAKIADANVTTAKILDANVTTPKIADGAVTPAKWANQYKFSAYNNATQSITTSGATVSYNTELFDSNNNFASSTYTAPVSGFYLFCIMLGWNTTGSLTRVQGVIQVNGSDSRRVIDISTGSVATVEGSAIIQLTAGNTVTVFCIPSGASVTLQDGTSLRNGFSGYLISQT